MEAISMAGTVLAILSKEGVVMVAEKVDAGAVYKVTLALAKCYNDAASFFHFNRKSQASCLTFH
jgi:hypothetical protein